MKTLYCLTWFLLPALSGLLFYSKGQAQERSVGIPKLVSSFASKLLREVYRTRAFPGVKGQSYVLNGESKIAPRNLRTIAVSGSSIIHLDWDSDVLLKDSYFGVLGTKDFDAKSDGSFGYTVTIRGCAPHECSDGKIGFAVFSSRADATYVAHVTAIASTTITPQSDVIYHLKYYRVDYLPEHGIPDQYVAVLNRMICEDRSYSRPSLLPIKCKLNAS